MVESEVYATKRQVDQRSEGSSNNSAGKARATKKQKSTQPERQIAQARPRRSEASTSAPIPIDAVMEEVLPNDGNVSTAAVMGDKRRKVRAPPRRLKVTAPAKDIWEMLGDSTTSLTLKDWIILDKKVQKDLKDGLRFLGGRRPRKGKAKEVIFGPVPNPSIAVSTPTSITNPVPINLVEGESSDSESSTSGSSSSEENSTSGYESYDDSTSEGDSDNDTIYDYPYEKVLLETSTPLAILGMIKDQPARLILDSGSALSVINRSYAEKLGLMGSGDVVNIKTIETTKENRKRNQCEVTIAVPIRIGGRLRTEHMVIKEDNYSNAAGEPLVLLGMTFLKQYGITIHAKDNLVEVPVKNGTSSILIQAYSSRKPVIMENTADSGAEVYSVALRWDGSKPDGYDYMVEPITPMADKKYHGGITSLPGDEVYGDDERQGTTLPPDNLKSYMDEAIPDQGEFKYALNPETGVTTCGNLEDHEVSFEKITGELPVAIGTVVRENKLCFAEFGGPGLVKGVELKIEVKPDAKPVKSRAYQMSWEEDEYLKNELDSMLKLGLIRPSKGVWVSGIFFIRRATGGLRLIYDLRGINKNIVVEDFPMPNVFDVVTSFHGKKYFTVLDLANGFGQVALSEDSMKYTGFICKYGTFEHTRIPFGLNLSPGFFNRTLMNILGPYIGTYFHLFVDDVIIGTATIEEHAYALGLLFRLLEEANLKLKWAKAEIFKTEITYLGHRISADGVKPTGHNVQKITDMRPPENVSELKSFLGTVNFYRKFIPTFAETAGPLTNLLKKTVKYTWSEDCQTAFNKLKDRLTSAPLLAHPSPYQVQRLTTDCAPSQGLGCILSQSPDGTEKDETVIAYASRSMRSNYERSLGATEGEAMAVVWGVKYFRQYLAGREFVLVSDHASLKYILNNVSPNSKINRWAAALMGFRFVFRYKPGSQIPSDSLSRIHPKVDSNEEDKHLE